MKILMAAETFPPDVNGAAIATERLAIGLAKLGHSVSIITSSQSLKSSSVTNGPLNIYRVPSVLINKAQGFRVSPGPLHFRIFKQIIDELKPDIIHVNNPGLITQTAIRYSRKMKIPIIGSAHFMAENLAHYFHLPRGIERILSAGIWKLYANIYNKLDLIIAPTPATENLLRKAGVKKKIVVLSNGIDLSKFNLINNADYLRKRLNLTKDPVILFVGRLEKEKQIDVLFKAAAIINEKIDFQIIIVGKGTEEKFLKKLANDLGIKSRITIVGYLPKDDLPYIYKTADVFVIPSIAELQSLVTMEAMASGLPVIGANAVALPHLIKDGKNGFLFEPTDDKELSDKLQMLLESSELRKKMGKASLEIIRNHDINKIVKQAENIFLEAIKIHS
jgi:1,2-diacylglycerol 3-alpha-glucosyltransferase